MRICFSLGSGLVAVAACLSAAGPSAEPRRITSVVHPDVRTGKLVRSVSIAPRAVSEKVIAPVVVPETAPAPPAPEPAPVTNFSEAVDRIAEQHSLPPALVHAVIKVESNYNPNAISSKGAQGLMQLIPSTARRFGVSNVFNPVENIQGGAKYLRYLLNLYNGNYPLALAAYNAGEKNVERYRGVPPFPETQNYLVLVRKQLEERRKAAEAAERQKAAEEKERQARAAQQKDAPAVNHIAEVVDGNGAVRYVTR